MILNKFCPLESRKFQTRNITTPDHVWTSLGHLDAFGHVSTHLDVFGRIWTGFGQVWTGFGRVWKGFRGLWRSLEEFEEVLK